MKEEDYSNFFEIIEKDEDKIDIEGWKVLKIMEDEFIGEEESGISYYISNSLSNLTLKTNEEIWIADFFVKIIKISELEKKFLVLVSPECPSQYLLNEELKKDIINPIKELIINNYFSLFKIKENNDFYENFLKYKLEKLGGIPNQISSDGMNGILWNENDSSSAYWDYLTTSSTSSSSNNDEIFIKNRTIEHIEDLLKSDINAKLRL